jgi:hypothetical protein
LPIFASVEKSPKNAVLSITRLAYAKIGDTEGAWKGARTRVDAGSQVDGSADASVSGKDRRMVADGVQGIGARTRASTNECGDRLVLVYDASATKCFPEHD